MKKSILAIVMATLCLFFKAQAQDNKAIDVTTKGIQIGQQVPDLTINNIYNYTSTTAKLSDFKGKLVILDFWATWCSPCVAMIPKMDSLQKQFGDKIQFLSITDQTKQEVIPFLEKLQNQRNRHSNIPYITDDKELHQLFPHVYLPHYVWIDQNGKVKAITEHFAVTSTNISKMLESNTAIHLKKKTDVKIAYDKTKPLFQNGNGGDQRLITYQSIFSKYAPGVTGQSWLIHRKLPDSTYEISLTAVNNSIKNLFKRAYGKGSFLPNSRIQLSVKDSTRLSTNLTGSNYIEWMSKNNAFCYELSVVPEMEPMIFSIMQKDLNFNLWQYSAEFEKQQKHCIILTRINSLDKLKTKGGTPNAKFSMIGCKLQNKSLDLLIQMLQNYYMQTSDKPIIDESGYTNNVDLEINANLSSIEQLNKQLEPYGLRFIEAIRAVDILVIKDRSMPDYRRQVMNLNSSIQ